MHRTRKVAESVIGQKTWRTSSTRCSEWQVGPTYLTYLSSPNLQQFIGLSLLGYAGLEDLDPVYCMPAKLTERMGLRKGWKALERRN